MTPFPSKDFTAALKKADRERPDVLVMVLFGQEMANAIRAAHKMGMKDRMQIVVPNLTLGMAERGGPRAMQGVVGTVPWCWQIPYKYNYDRGIKFVEDFQKKGENRNLVEKLRVKMVAITPDKFIEVANEKN